MKKVNLLSRAEMRKVMGGLADPDGTGTPGGDNGNPCGNGGCSKINHQNDDGSFGNGPCSSGTGGSSCHNYCVDGFSNSSLGYYGWC